MEKELVATWDRYMDEYARPFLDMHSQTNRLMASDVTFAIGDAFSKGQPPTHNIVLNYLIERYPDRWEKLPNHEKIKDNQFKRFVKYYVDWYLLDEETRNEIKEYRKNRYFKNNV